MVENPQPPVRSVGAMLRRDVRPADLGTHARAVADGFDELWVVEDLPFAGGISQATAVLEATAGVGGGAGPVVGHGIAPAPFRNPAALAMEWATLAEMYPGRVSTGVGHGVPSWMEQIGERVASPLTLLEETIDVVQRLLRGERVDVDGRYVSITDVQLVFPPSQVPVVSAGVMGPKSLELAGRIAGGTVLPEGRGPGEVRAAKSLIDRGRVAAGRTDLHRLSVFTGFYCGPLDRLGPPPPDAPGGWAAVAETPSECIVQLQSIIDAGADAVILVPFGDDMEQQLQLGAAEIVPHLDRG